MHGDTVKCFSLILSALDNIIQLSLQVNFIKICQTNKVLVTASRDGSFCIWDIVQVIFLHIVGKSFFTFCKIYAKLYRAWDIVQLIFLHVLQNIIERGAQCFSLCQRVSFDQISRNKRFLAFLSSMWNIQWSILSTYYIYPLDIFVCTYHYMIHWCRSWRKVRSRWKRTTTLSRSSSQSRSWRRKMVSYYFVISFWFDWQQVLKNSTWNGGLGKLHDDMMIIVW